MEEGFSIFDIFKMLWRNKVILIVMLIISVSMAVCYCCFLMENQYESKSALLIVMKKDETTKEYDYNNSMVMMHTVSQLPKQEIILKKVALKNHVEVSELIENIEVSSPASSLFLIITYTCSDKAQAKAIANDIVDTLIQECKTNPDLAMIGASLLKTSNALDAVYVGKNKSLYGIGIVLGMMALVVCVVIGKEMFWKDCKSRQRNIKVINQLENI